jgi:hypothetical protein
MGASPASSAARMSRAAAIGVIVAGLVAHARTACAHGTEMLLGSSATGGGALAVAYEFADPVVVTPSVSIGGTTLYTSLFPGFEWLQADDAADALYVLKVGTPFSMQIVRIDPGAAVMIGGTTLNAAGRSAFVAQTTNVAGDHFHPQWELVLPAGVTGQYQVTFRLTTTDRTYTGSQEYTLMLSNVPPAATATPTIGVVASSTPAPNATPTFTNVPPPGTAAATPTADVLASTTPTPSASPTAASTAHAGDANCDGRINAADLPRLTDLIAHQAPPVCGADAQQDGSLDVQDLDVTVGLIFGHSVRR